MAAEKGVGAAGLATGGEVAGKATAKTGQAAAEEADAAAAWSAGASGLARTAGADLIRGRQPAHDTIAHLLVHTGCG